MAEREIRGPLDLCTARGRLNPPAVGWSRQPVHRCNLAGAWPRKKRWHHWCITTPDWLLALTLADLDYLGLASVLYLDLASGQAIDRVAVHPFGWGLSWPEEVERGQVSVDHRGLHLAFRESEDGTLLEAALPRLSAELAVHRPPGYESLSVVVPWSERRFQYTSKQVGLPVEGRLEVDGRDCSVGGDAPAYACLDFGRGIWPYRTVWNWASAAGAQGGATIGLNLGGRWTDGTGATENGAWTNGRLAKIAEDVRFTYDRADFRQPWSIESVASSDVALRLDPTIERRFRLNLAVLAVEIHSVVGAFAGRLLGQPVRGLLGWAEEFRARW